MGVMEGRSEEGGLFVEITNLSLRDNRAVDIEARFLFCRLDLGGGSGMKEVRGLFVDYLAHKIM